ncbi:MAG: TRAP transporter large permease subunit, partial [Pseudomonadota bacterium]
MSEQTVAISDNAGPPSRALGTEPPQELMRGPISYALATACAVYAAWHLYVLNIAPLETWVFRISHVGGALALGFLLSGLSAAEKETTPVVPWARALAVLSLVGVVVAGALVGTIAVLTANGATAADLPGWLLPAFGPIFVASAGIGIVAAWLQPPSQQGIRIADWSLALAAIIVAAYFLVALDALALRLRAGTPFADPSNMFAAMVGVALILEVTRRLAGSALVIIAVVFIAYAFVGPFLPGFLNHSGYTLTRFFTYVYTDNGILGPTTAVSSTYIMLFIMFAAFLQVTKVGQYFVDFSFALAGRARGGPAKVAVFASGLMGTINGTSAGNVVATGSITIPLMKKVGYKPKTSAAIEATASTGGQIMPPVMGAGAFIMAEITG